jgi:hypothetical protein
MTQHVQQKQQLLIEYKNHTRDSHKIFFYSLHFRKEKLYFENEKNITE